VELVCVLAILIILAVILDNSLAGAHRRTAREQCRNNLQTIFLALNIYSNDNHGTFPVLKDAAVSSAPLSLLLPKSTTETAIFLCPGSKDAPLPEGESFAQRRISYAYYMGRATNTDASADPSPQATLSSLNPQSAIHNPQSSAAPQAILSDWQLNTLPKTKGQPLFSPDGKKPANNHGKDGGNILLDTGEVIFSGTNAVRDLPIPPGVTLLNPAP
jgi:type II secretory pathway pseudopilin PulG